MRLNNGFKGISMRIRVLTLYCGVWSLLFSSLIGATLEEAYNQGLTIGETFKEPPQELSSQDMTSLSGNVQDKSQKAHWQNNLSLPENNLSDAAVSEVNANSAGQFVTDTEKARAKFETAQKTNLEDYASIITPQAPALIKNQSQNCVEIPFLEQQEGAMQYTCESSREPEEKTCIRYLKEPTVTVIPAKYSHYWCSAGNHRPDDPNCRAKTYYNPARLYQAEQIIITSDEWVSQCAPLDAKPECKRVKITCLQPNETRIINGKPVTKPCWKEEHRYACQYPSKNDCASFHQPDCQQIASLCQLNINGKCYIWKHKYECKKGQTLKTKRICGKDVFCIQGDCTKTKDEPSRDFLEVMAQLSIFDEIQKNKGPLFPEIFRGSTEQCKKDVINFKSCCKLGGWGTDLGFADCNSEEKALAQKRGKKLCHEIGQYCSKKRLGICIEKKTVFCCFGSKLMRLLHEQGRAQANLGWGTPECPVCRGFTIEELSRIDFSQLNLSEIFQDLKTSFSSQTLERMQTKVQNRLKSFQNPSGKEGQQGL